MTPSDRTEFGRVINGLAAIKPGGKITTEGLEIFWQAMQDWPLGEFKAAAAHLANTCEFMPNPYHFAQLRKASEITYAEAWAEVLALVRRSSHLHGATCGGKIDRVVRAIGGYEAIGNSAVDKTHFLERRFAEVWETISDAEETRDALPHLTSGKQLDGPQPMASVMARIGNSW